MAAFMEEVSMEEVFMGDMVEAGDNSAEVYAAG
jgi:hypothetical protein